MIDEIGLKILKILQEKARIPNVEVARQVGMAPSAVLERIRKLEKQGFIDGYEVRLNPVAFSRSLIAFVFVEVDTALSAEAGDELARIPDVQEVHFAAGEDAWLVKVRVADTAELGLLIRENIASIKGVRRTRTLPVLSTVKETTRFPIREQPQPEEDQTIKN